MSLFKTLGDLWRKKFLGLPDLAKPPRFDEADDEFFKFMMGEWIYTPTSTNVWGWRWLVDTNQLEVGYVGWKNHRDESKLRFYSYQDVGEDLAREFYTVASKKESAGGKVWDDLRERGTVCGKKKDYVFLSGFRPKNPCP